MHPATPPAPTAVVGHVEWVTHAIGSLPARGASADLADPIEEPAGGGAVAAAAIARATGSALLFTALGKDHAAATASALLGRPGLEVLAARRAAAQTPVLSITESDGERTIMVVGPRLQATAEDPLGWARLATCQACYYAGEDPGALLRARSAPVLVVTARRTADVLESRVVADVIVASAADPDEDPSSLPAALRPRWTVLTDGPRGGTVTHRDGGSWRYPAAPRPGEMVDSYGCGDTFAGCLAAALGRGDQMEQAVVFAAGEAARCTTWRGGLGPVR